eukprot:gb/GECG01013289.1/.p1 GENE.gb/GECG01013289.1/~~gb/GECG01013289.1/.p1  ORF type:complete len:877 (+),score=109.95 gb/GECG01013289.1/:1-2631(+)
MSRIDGIVVGIARLLHFREYSVRRAFLSGLFASVAFLASQYDSSAYLAFTMSSTPSTSTDHGWNFQVNSPPHVIVVGGGLAGLSATLEAVQQGARVTLIERNPKLGGNSEKASSGMNAVGTEIQKQHGVTDDSVALFKDDTMQSGHGKADEALVDTLVHSSKDAIDFIASYGVTLDKVSQCGGHSKPRTHRPGPGPDGKVTPVGRAIMKALSEKVQSMADSVEVMLETSALRLLTEDIHRRGSTETKQRVAGIELQNETRGNFELKGDAVILTSGGYGGYRGENSLLQKHAPQVSYLPSTNGNFARGDGVQLAKEVGALLRHMQYVQVHPTGFVDPKDPENNTKFLAPEALRGVGGLLISPRSGKRFVNELGRRDDVTESIQQECGRTDSEGKWKESCYLILTHEAAHEFGPTFGFYHKVKGFFQEFDSLSDAAKKLGLPEDSLRASLQEYSEVAASGKPDRFGKKSFPSHESFKSLLESTDANLYVAIITPSVHYTMGGVAINAAGEVLGIPESHETEGHDVSLEDSTLSAVETGLETPVPDQTRSGTRHTAKLPHFQPHPIPGLFAAGEASGGVHGANRLAGNSLLECVVFGRIAGKRSASFREMSTSCMKQDSWTPLRLRESFPLCGDQYVFRFDLPSPLHTVAGNAEGRVGGAVGKFIKVRAKVNNEDVVRCYSPASRLGALGYIDLLVKIDSHGGTMSYHMRDMKPGDTLDFSGLHGKLSLDFRPSAAAKDGGAVYQGRSIKKINLLAGGTGIAPMLSIIHSVLHHRRHDIAVNLLYGANQPGAIAFKDGLDHVAANNDNIGVTYTVDRVPEGQSWSGRVGFIDESVIREALSPPGEDVLLVICGPYKMCQVLKGLVKNAGYTDEMVYCYM